MLHDLRKERVKEAWDYGLPDCGSWYPGSPKSGGPGAHGICLNDIGLTSKFSTDYLIGSQILGYYSTEIFADLGTEYDWKGRYLSFPSDLIVFLMYGPGRSGRCFPTEFPPQR